MKSHPPDIQVYARIRGAIQWECPRCGNFNIPKRKHQRLARVVCVRCNARYRLGVGLHINPSVPRCLVMNKWDHFTSNRLNLACHDYRYGNGRLSGLLHWECPSCHAPHFDSIIDWYKGGVGCRKCLRGFAVQLLLWVSSPGRHHLTCPMDWTMPKMETKIKYDGTPHAPLPPTPSSQGDGAAS